MANRVVEAKGHELCSLRDKFSTLFKRSHLHQPIDYSGTRPLDGTSSPSPKRIASSIRRQLIDYSGTRLLDGTSSSSPKRVTSSMRRQWVDYSGTRHLDGTSSLYLKKKFSSTIQHLVDYYGTRPPKDKPPIYKIYSSMKTSTNRLLRYSI